MYSSFVLLSEERERPRLANLYPHQCKLDADAAAAVWVSGRERGFRRVLASEIGVPGSGSRVHRFQFGFRGF